MNNELLESGDSSYMLEIVDNEQRICIVDAEEGTLFQVKSLFNKEHEGLVFLVEKGSKLHIRISKMEGNAHRVTLLELENPIARRGELC